MKLSKYGFFVPEYGDEAYIPTHIALNIEILEKLLDSGIITGNIDGGCWDDRTVIDGGGYTSAAENVIDGGNYTSAGDRVIDGGEYQ